MGACGVSRKFYADEGQSAIGIGLPERGEFLVSFFVRPFFRLPKPSKILYKITALASDVSLRRATLYPAELRVPVLTRCLRGNNGCVKPL